MPTGQAAEQAAQRKTETQAHPDDDRGPGSVSGNLTKDPDLRWTNGGTAVTNLRVASSERVQNPRTQQWEDGPTAYFDVTCWGRLAENVCESLQRGDRVVAEGRWISNTWEDSEGKIQERIILRARDLGPSMAFRTARPDRKQRES